MKAFLAAFFLVLVSATVANYCLDPLGKRALTPEVGELPPGYLYPARGGNVHLLKLRMLRHAPPGSDFILGSSRVLAWGTPQFPPGRPVVNLAITNAEALDYFPLLDELIHSGNAHAVYVELSPWTFSARTRDETPENRFLERPPERYSYEELLSFSVLRQALLGLRNDDLPGRPLAPGNTERYGYRPDGRFRYPASYEARSTSEVVETAVSAASAPHIELLEAGLNLEKVRRLCDRVRALHAKQVAVQLLTVPWNPAATQRVAQRHLSYTVQSVHEELVEAVQRSCDEPVHRFEAACPQEEFFDDHHPRPACFDRLAAKLELLTSGRGGSDRTEGPPGDSKSAAADPASRLDSGKGHP